MKNMHHEDNLGLTNPWLWVTSIIITTSVLKEMVSSNFKIQFATNKAFQSQEFCTLTILIRQELGHK